MFTTELLVDKYILRQVANLVPCQKKVGCDLQSRNNITTCHWMNMRLLSSVLFSSHEPHNYSMCSLALTMTMFLFYIIILRKELYNINKHGTIIY